MPVPPPSCHARAPQTLGRPLSKSCEARQSALIFIFSQMPANGMVLYLRAILGLKEDS